MMVLPDGQLAVGYVGSGQLRVSTLGSGKWFDYLTLATTFAGLDTSFVAVAAGNIQYTYLSPSNMQVYGQLANGWGLGKTQPNLFSLGGSYQHRYRHRRNVDDVSQQEPGITEEHRQDRQRDEIDQGGDHGVPERYRHRLTKKRNAQDALPVQTDILDESVRPTP
jgi:hypothetical protein